MWRRYTLVRQNDSSDCGAASLATIALHYRRAVGLEQMRDLTGTDTIGTNLLALLRGAEALGFAAKALKATYAVLHHLPLPAIVHLQKREDGHFVVLHRVRKHSVLVADPASGLVKYSRAEFEQLWSGHVLIMVPEPRVLAARSGRKPPRPWRRFLSLLGDQRSILLEAIFCALIMTLLGVTTSYFVEYLVDSVLVRQQARLLNALGIGMAVVVSFRSLFAMLRQYLLAHIARKLDLSLIAGYARHILALPLRFFETRRVGEVLSRVTDTAKVREAVSGTTTTVIVDGVVVLLLLGVLWLQDWPLAAAATAFVPLLLLAVAAHHPATRRRAREAMEGAAQLSSHLIEDTSGVRTIKAFGAQRGRAEQGEARLVELAQANFALQKLGLRMNGLGLFATSLAGIVLLWFGGHRVMEGALTIGQLLFCYTLLVYLLDPLERLSLVNLKIQDALVAIDRIFQVLDLEPEQRPDEQRAAFTGLQSAIALRDVSFQYGIRAKVLDNLTLTIPAGSTVAIVGESGSGKSTLLNLLLGFYRPTAGRILLDGTDLGDFDLNSVRDRIGLVSQDPYIFNDSVRANIALGRPEASLEEVIAAARAAGLDEFIAGLPERYATRIGERGANLSGGQRQRLAIARALLRRPDILIFDEATSHLDTTTERTIQQSLRTHLRGKTVVLVAHRLNTIRHADLICVLHQGRIVEQGTHEQLLERGGKYAALYHSQIVAEDGSVGRRPNPNRSPGAEPRSTYDLLWEAQGNLWTGAANLLDIKS
jgi:ATP-binding cassette subfamily B protein